MKADFFLFQRRRRKFRELLQRRRQFTGVIVNRNGIGLKISNGRDPAGLIPVIPLVAKNPGFRNGIP